jgi:hypothetical protein
MRNKKLSTGIARDGADKAVQKEFPAHSGMTHVTKDALGGNARVVGVSRTQAEQVLGTDGVGDVTSKGGQPKQTQVGAEPHPSAHGSHDPESGRKILDEATISGSHLPRKK